MEHVEGLLVLRGVLASGRLRGAGGCSSARTLLSGRCFGVACCRPCAAWSVNKEAPPAPRAQPRPLARHRSAYTHGVCAHESTYDTAYVPASLSHVQLYVAVSTSVTSSHRQFASGEHVFGSHPSTSAPNTFV